MAVTISFGGLEHEHLQLEVFGYERQPVGEYYDDNWVTVRVVVAAGKFRGKVDTSFLTTELISLLSELRELHKSLHGNIEFRPTEPNLRFRLGGDGKGHISLDGELTDRMGVGNTLRFALLLDQTQLELPIRQLEQVGSLFPERK